MLKKISFICPNLSLVAQNKIFDFNNVSIYGYSNFVKDVNLSESICLVLMMNPKTECSLLNARLRRQCRNSLLSLFSFGQFMLTNTPVNFVFLNIENFMYVFEGKSYTYSDLLIESTEPLILVGDSIYSKFPNILGVISSLLKVNNSCKFLKISSSCNAEGVSLSNIKSLNTNQLKKSSYLLCVDLDDIFSVRKYLILANKTLLWLNSHGSKVALKAKMILPLLTEFEEERTLLNLEHRPQKTQKTFNGFFDGRSLKSVLCASFQVDGSKKTSRYAAFLTEILDTPSIFDTFNRKFSFIAGSYLYGVSSPFFVKKSINKLSVEDFYLTNKLTKNSFAMQESSKVLHEASNNFPLFS